MCQQDICVCPLILKFDNKNGLLTLVAMITEIMCTGNLSSVHKVGEIVFSYSDIWVTISNMLLEFGFHIYHLIKF